MIYRTSGSSSLICKSRLARVHCKLLSRRSPKSCARPADKNNTIQGALICALAWRAIEWLRECAQDGQRARLTVFRFSSFCFCFCCSFPLPLGRPSGQKRLFVFLFSLSLSAFRHLPNGLQACKRVLGARWRQRDKMAARGQLINPAGEGRRQTLGSGGCWLLAAGCWLLASGHLGPFCAPARLIAARARAKPGRAPGTSVRRLAGSLEAARQGRIISGVRAINHYKKSAGRLVEWLKKASLARL